MKNVIIGLIVLTGIIGLTMEASRFFSQAGFELKTPVFATGPVTAEVLRYDEEFVARSKAKIAEKKITDPLFQGTIKRSSTLPNGAGLVQTSVGESWTEGQHFYFRASRQEKWRELEPPYTSWLWSFLMEKNGKPVVIYSGSEFGPSGVDELILYDPQNGQTRKLFLGNARPAPNGKYALLYQNWKSNWGYRTWDASTEKSIDLFSLKESDPGSGTSWGIYWSEDSNAIHFLGDSTDRGNFNWIYLVSENKLYQLPYNWERYHQ